MTTYAYAPTTSLGSPKKNSIRLVPKDEWVKHLSSIPKNTKFFISIDSVLTETKSLKAEQMPCNELPNSFWVSNLAPDYMPVNVIRKFKK